MKKRKDFEVSVFGETWNVIYITPIIEEGQRAYGLCDSDSNTLYVDSSLDNRMTAITFFHELFHAYFRRMGMINAGVPHYLEEIMADQFATLIAENFDFDF